MRLVKVIARDGRWQMKEEGGNREEEIRQGRGNSAGELHQQIKENGKQPKQQENDRCE
jgi:hypothetical protein